MSEEKILIKKIPKKKKNELLNYLEKQLDEKPDAVNISNQRTNKIPVIAIDNYNNTLKEYDSLYAAYKEIQINSGMIIYSCKNMHKPKKKYTFCYKKKSLNTFAAIDDSSCFYRSLPSTTQVVR